jgi:hypothetical protein
MSAVSLVFWCAQVSKGSLLSYGVVVGARHTVPDNSHISLCRQVQCQVKGVASGSGVNVGGRGPAHRAERGGFARRTDCTAPTQGLLPRLFVTM